MKTYIIYGSTMGNTASAAEKIHALLDGELVEVSNANEEMIKTADCLILGTSTWGIGDLQDNWLDFAETLKGLDLSGKTIALFGLGDQSSYSDSFVDGVGTLYQIVKQQGAKVIGQTPTDGYTFTSSTAVIENRFAGLILDDDNQSDMTDQRITNWTSQLKEYING